MPTTATATTPTTNTRIFKVTVLYIKACSDLQNSKNNNCKNNNKTNSNNTN